MHPLSRVLLLVTLLILTFNGSAQQSSTTVPNLIRYGGVVKDAQGAALASRTVGITFLIYGQQDGGAPVWLETQNVATDAAGQYSVLLGSTTAIGLPSDLFAQQEQRWLAVKAEGQPEQLRVLLVSVPYAMKAAEADRLAGHSVSEFVTTDNLQSAVQRLQGQAAKVAAGAPTVTNGKSMAAGNAPVPTNPATNFVDNTTNQVVLVQQNGTGVGLQASSPNNVGVLGTVNSLPKAGISAGVEGTSSINNGYGMFGYSTATTGGIGVQGRSDSPNGIGVRGFTIGTSGVAVSALSNATSGNPIGLLSSISAPGGTGALITNTATGTITGPLITATTNNVTQFTVGATGNVSAAGSLSGKQFISTVATGTAPLQVASTTLVPNLNASLLGGSPASAFALASGSPNYIQNGTGLQSANLNIGGNASANTINSTTSYQIGGGTVLYTGNPSLNSLFVGLGAGGVSSAGNQNTFVGPLAGNSNTAGGGNSYFGYAAGSSNSVGGSNSFFGDQAGNSNTSGAYNSFLGVQSGFTNSTGQNNSFFGSAAGYSNTTGSLNVSVGANSGGSDNTNGGANVFVGSYAAQNNTTGGGNTIVGYTAGLSNTTGSNNVFYGYGAGGYNNTGSNNVYVAAPGVGAENNTIRIGQQGSGPHQQNATYIVGISGASTSGGVPVFIDATGKLGTTGGSLGDVVSFNGRAGAVVAVANDYSFSQLNGTLGISQLRGTYTSPLTLNNSSNSFAGSFTGSGAGLTSVPVSAGSPNYVQNGTSQQPSSGFNISGNGVANGFNSATSYQIGGSDVLTVGGTLSYDLFLGFGAGANNQVQGPQGTGNVFSGYQAGYSNFRGYSNTFGGYKAGYLNTNGYNNLFTGAQAGYATTLGHDNVFIGVKTGYNNTTGSNDTFIGSGAGPDTTNSNLTNATAIGANAIVSASNALVLGGIGANAVNVGVGTAAPSAPLEVVGNLKLTGNGNALVFPDGSQQATATLQGPQGPAGPTGPQGLQGSQGPQGSIGPQGPAVHTSAVCVNLASIASCTCNYSTILRQIVTGGASCTVTSDTGSCTASSVGSPYNLEGACCVCSP